MDNQDSFKRHKESVEAVNVGHLLLTKGVRDAIHIAVCPMTAGELLYPGQAIRLENGKATSIGRKMSLGIVDPFLIGPVQQGERFYVFLHPGTITSLRHQWTHPDLPMIDPLEHAQLAASKRMTKAASEVGHTLETYIEAVQHWRKYGTYGGSDPGYGRLLGHDYYELYYEWWSDWELLTGEHIEPEDHDRGGFTCSC